MLISDIQFYCGKEQLMQLKYIITGEEVFSFMKRELEDISLQLIFQHNISLHGFTSPGFHHKKSVHQFWFSKKNRWMGLMLNCHFRNQYNKLLSIKTNRTFLIKPS